MQNAHTARGFTLVEALLASVLVSGALVTLAHIVSTGVSQTSALRRTLASATLAQSKLEELRALTWRFAIDGARISSAALGPSPLDSLTTDAAGWVEALDRFGAPAARDRPETYRRRWSIAALSPLDTDTLVLRVCVFPSGNAAAAAAADACVAALLTRKP